MSDVAQFPGQIFLQLVTAVVGGDADAFRRFKCARTNVFNMIRSVHFPARKTLSLLAAANNGVNTP